jgi:hypothetical protein
MSEATRVCTTRAIEPRASAADILLLLPTPPSSPYRPSDPYPPPPPAPTHLLGPHRQHLLHYALLDLHVARHGGDQVGGAWGVVIGL